MIKNRIYGDYYKLYRLILMYVKSSISSDSLKAIVESNSNLPKYDKLDDKVVYPEEVLKTIKDLQEERVEVDICIVGSKAESFFHRLDLNIVSLTSQLGDKPSVQDLIGSVKVMIDAFDEKNIDQLFLFSNEFVNTISQVAVKHQLLPVVPDSNEALDYHWDYIYEPDAKVLLDILLVRYVESQVYRGVVENIACEQASRMIAMKNASDNASDVIDELNLQFNKARQAAITQELAEIVSGASIV